MCSHEHLCVIAVPTTSCFRYVCPLSYFYSIGVLQLVGATMCVLSAMLTLLRSSFSVLCVCTLPYSNNYYCYHYLLYHWLLPIMPVLVEFLLLLEFLCAVICPSANRTLFFNMSAIYHIFSSIEVWQLGCSDIVCCLQCLPRSVPVFSVLCVCTCCLVWCLCPEL